MKLKPEAWKNTVTGELSRVEVAGKEWVELFLKAEFDAISTKQEELAIKYSIELCNGSRPDAVSVLEMADALYTAEMELNGS
jgi:hypothetical protein